MNNYIQQLLRMKMIVPTNCARAQSCCDCLEARYTNIFLYFYQLHSAEEVFMK